MIKSNAQTPFTNWEYTPGDASGADKINATCIDNSGNLIVVGHFFGTIDLDNGPSDRLLTAVGQYDGFIAKYNPFGELIWAYRLGGTLGDQVNSVAVDNFNSIYLTGFFLGTMNVSSRSGSSPLVSIGNSADIFIAKYNTDGFLFNLYRIGAGGNDRGNVIKVDNGGNIYLSGAYSSPGNTTNVNFNVLGGTNNLLAAGSEDGFVVKYNSTFGLQWVKSYGGGAFNDGCVALDVDLIENVYVSGYFNGTNAGFNNGIFISASGQDGFVMKLNPLGNTAWAKKIGGGNSDIITSIKLDGKGALFACGNFTGLANLNPNGLAQNFTAVGIDGFISKLDTNLASAIWIRPIGGPSALDQAFSVSADTLGNVYATGSFSGTAQFPIGTSASQLISAGSKDIFVVKLNSLGNYVWGKKFGGINDDEATSISTTANGQSSYVGGAVTPFDQNVFMAKLGTCAEIGPINGAIKLCSASPVVYSVDSVPGAFSYNWTLPAGYSGTSSARSITVTPGASSGTISVNVVTACGVGFTRDIAVTYGNSTLDANLIRYYSANAGDGNKDLKNNFGMTLTLTSKDTDRFGTPNSAYKIDGVTSFIKLEPEATLPGGPSSIAFWYYYVKNGGGNNVLIGSNSTVLPLGHPLLYTNNANNRLYPSSNAGIIGSGVVLAENNWNHIVLARNGANFAFYFNGKLAYSGNTLSLTNFDRIGNNRPGFELQGALGKFDDIKIYNVVLSEVQVKNVYDFGSFKSNTFVDSTCKNTGLSFQALHNNIGASYAWKLNGNTVGTNAPSYSKIGAITDSAISVTVTNNCFIETIGRNFKVNTTDSVFIQSSTCGIEIGNSKYYVTGNYRDTLVNKAGCDSIVYLNLTITGNPSSNLSNGLIRYWTLNNQDSLKDNVSKQALLNGFPINYVANRFGQPNSAINNIQNGEVFRPATSLPNLDYTISFWYNFTSGSSSTRALLSNNLTTNAGYKLYIDPSGILKSNNSAGVAFSGIKTLLPNQWVHLTYAVLANGTAQIYLNGKLEIFVNTTSTSGIVTRIGNGITNNNSTPGLGIYDDIRVYNRVLSATEIDQLNNRPSLVNFPANKNYCAGDSINFKIGINHLSTAQFQVFKNTLLVGSDSSYTLNNIAITDTLLTYKITSLCAFEEYRIPLNVFETQAIKNDSFCGAYVFNGKTYTNAGTFFDTIQNANGCKLVTQLNLINTGSTNLNTGLIRYWTANGVEGRISLVGKDTLAPIGNVFVTGQPGRAENPNGSYYVGLINGTYLKTNLPSISTYTISFWYKMEQNGTNRILNLIANNSNAAAGSVILQKLSNNNLHVLNAAGTSIGAGFPMLMNVWNHITLSRNGANFALYVNGNLISSGTNINSANPDHIGNNGQPSNGNSAIGWFDDIRVHNFALTANQVSNLPKMPSLISVPNFNNYCIGYPGNMAFQFQKDSTASYQFLRNGVVVANDTSFQFSSILPSDTSVGYRIIKGCATETINLTFSSQPVNLNNGLIRYWTFNDALITRQDLATNESYAFRGDFVNGTGRTELANTGINISGVGKIIYANTGLPTTNITVSLWYRRPSSSATVVRTIISNDQSNGNIAKYLWMTNNGQVYCGTNTISSGTNTGLILNANQWHHFVYHISSAGTVTLYVNGNLALTQTGVPVHPITYFGNRPDGNEPGVGNYDDIKIYNRALTAIEISKLYGMPSLLSVYQNISACAGSTVTLNYPYGPAAKKAYSFTKNGAVVGTDSFLVINAISAADTLYNFSVNTNCGQENHIIKITVNPSGGVGPNLTYNNTLKRITVTSTYNTYKLFRNGKVVDSSNVSGNINYLTQTCGNYYAEFRNSGTGSCPFASPLLTLKLDTVQLNANICSGKTYQFGTINLSAAGTYFRTINNALGCDSTIRLNLILRTASSNTITRSNCGPLNLNGKLFTQSGQYKDTLINAAGCDSLLTLNLTILSGIPSLFNLNATACKQYVLNGKTYTNAGIYRDTLFGGSASGCDSIIVLNLNLTKINRAIVKNGNKLTVQESSASYKWLNCQTNQIISGQTGIDFTPIVSGNYAAIITKNTCVDTSNCMLVTISNCKTSITYQVLNPQDSIRCKSVKVQVNSATLPLNLRISWTENTTGNTIQITDSVYTYTNVCPETYKLRVTDALGCKDSLTFTIQEPSVGLNERELDQLNLFPNPAQDQIFVTGIPNQSSMSIFDIHGKLVLNQIYEGDNKPISCAHLANGVYLLKIDSQTKTSSRKLVIQK